MSAEASMDDEHSENLARLTEQRLRESEEHFRLALEAGQMGTWKWDAVTGLLTADAAHQAIFGLPPHDQPLLICALGRVRVASNGTCSSYCSPGGIGPENISLRG